MQSVNPLDAGITRTLVEPQQQLLQALGILPLTEHRLRQANPRVAGLIKQNSFTHRLKIRPHGGAPTWGQSRFYAWLIMLPEDGAP